ncbi:MAG: hypothetical protein ACXAB7_06805 [Candidatus Kariarchaeaceae archaeon]|jgi:hypothetical protein
MKIIKLFFSIVLISMLVLSATVSTNAKVDSEKKSDSITIETDTLAVDIKGGANVPFFFWWEQGEESSTYKLQLDQIFEAFDNNSNSEYDLGEDRRIPNSHISLPALNWDFSEFDVVTDANDVTTELHFNLTSTGNIGNPLDDGLFIQFRMHITSANDAELKFDVVIDGYEFSDPDAMLVLGFKLITTGKHDPVKDGDTVEFGDGYLQSESTAVDGNETIASSLSTGEEEGSKKIYVSYEHFDGHMVHDPTIGVASMQVSDGDETTDQSSGQVKRNIMPELSKAALFTSSILATLGFVLIPTAVYFYRRRS